MMLFNPRSSSTLISLLLGTLLFLSSTPTTYSAVVGVDVGSELFKIGSASPGRPFEVVLNIHSKRKTPSVVSFVEETREFGEAALFHSTKEPSDVLLLVSSLLALNSSATPNPIESIVNPFFPINVVTNKERGISEIHLKRRNVTLAPEEIVANLLQFITRNVADFQGSSPRQTKLDAVLTVPSSFNMRQRQALMDASEIAGVNVLGVVRETSAAALHHVRDLPANFTGSKLFINMGAWRTQACVVDYNITTVKQRKMSTNVIYCDDTDRIGGLHFDLQLANFMAKKAEEKFKTKDLSPRAYQRLLQQAQKTKIVLSANRKSDIFIEGLHNEKSLHSSITREEFEGLIQPMLPSIHQLIGNVLKKSNIKKEQLNGVEIVGGAWRVPKVRQEIETIIKPHDLGQHVNGDEGAALGATLIAANASSTFRIKDTKFSDPSAYGYVVRLKNITTEQTPKQEWKTKEIIKIGGRFGGFRTLSTRSCHDVVAELIEVNGDGIQTLLTKYEIIGIKEACEGKHKDHGVAKVNVVFSVPPTGVVSLDRAVAQWEETYLAPAPKSTTTTTAASNDKKSDEKETTTTTTALTTTEEPKMIEQIRKHTMKCKVNTSETLPRPMTTEEIENAKKRLAEFDTIDSTALKLAKARNNLESFVYSTRSELDTESIQQISTEDARGKLREQLSDVEDWLYDDGISAPLEELEKRLHALKDEFAPMTMRAAEAEGRKALSQLIVVMNEKIEKSLSSEMLEKIELNTTRIEKFRGNWKEVNEWYDGKKNEQMKKAASDEPAYKTGEVKERLHKISKELESLMKSAKIKVPPVIVDTNSTASTNTTQSDNSTETQKTNDTSTESFDTEIPTQAPRRKEFSKASKTSDEL